MAFGMILAYLQPEQVSTQQRVLIPQHVYGGGVP
jgi:hypothetical protein